VTIHLWSLDAAGRRFQVGDLVTTTKRSWFGPGVRGEVLSVRWEDVTVTLATDLTARGRVTVRHHHVLVVERHTGVRVWLRKLWKRTERRWRG
jgi:hypothetical protein